MIDNFSMPRREFIALSASAFSNPRIALAQQKVWRVIYLTPGTISGVGVRDKT